MIMREFCIRVTWTFIIDMEKKRNGSKEWIDNDIDDATTSDSETSWSE